MKQAEIEQADQAELSVFKKKLRKLEEFRGRGTELISLYLPSGVDRSLVTSQLTEEMSQSSNIKSPATKKNVQGALRKIQNFLKQIDFRLPDRGLVLFCGNVSESEGKTDIQLFMVKPPLTLKTKLYWCDSEFHLAPLKEMAQPKEVYGIVSIDKSESTIAVLVGKRYEILGKFTSGVAGKSRAGGQSAARFERLREEAAHDFYKRISEKTNQAFLGYGEKLAGIIVGGPGLTKKYFLETELIDYRLREKVIGTLDTTYTDESGIREIVQKADELLKDTEIIKERKLIDDFLREVARDGLATFSQKNVEDALKTGKAKTVLVSEGIEWVVYRIQCNSCGNVQEHVAREPKKFDTARISCPKCQSITQIEITESIDYIDWIIEKAQAIAAETKVISMETSEGEQFYRGFEGIGAMLRYK